MGIWTHGKLSNCERGMDGAETVVLCVCATMSQEVMILSHVYLYVYVVSLITKLFYKVILKAFTQA